MEPRGEGRLRAGLDSGWPQASFPARSRSASQNPLNDFSPVPVSSTDQPFDRYRPLADRSRVSVHAAATVLAIP